MKSVHFQVLRLRQKHPTTSSIYITKFGSKNLDTQAEKGSLKKREMGVVSCSNDGYLNDAKFSEPLPWIGIYIAAASLVCLLAMAADLIHGIRHRKFWFPCKFFTLNSTSLTLIAVAIKLSVDLNTSMPGREDQLAKLSSAVLMCTIMANCMPSLGSMENQEIFMNVMALGILVITLIVNVVVPSTKSYLEMKYSVRHELASKECALNGKGNKAVIERLKEGLMKYWMMAQTTSPQFVMGRSATCTASGAICLLSAAILAEAILTSYLLKRSFKFCNGQSDYKWSITFILVIQCVAVVVGTIAPAIRWFTAIKFRCPKLRKGGYKKEFKLEYYWIRYLVEMKEAPLTIRVKNRRCRKLAHNAKNKFLDGCIILQTIIVFTSKVIRLISIFFFRGIFSFCDCFKSLKNKLCFNSTNSLNNSGSEVDADSQLDLSRFVLYLEGEDDLVHFMVTNNYHAVHHWIQKGKKKKPKILIQLLERTIMSRGFKGVVEFDNHQVPCLDSKEPQNCWALPVVTLTAIAISLPNISRHLIKHLVNGVNEGLRYIRLVEDCFDKEGDFENLKKAAEIVWLGIDLHNKWLDIDLHKISHHKESPKEILEQLSHQAKKIYSAERTTNQLLCLKLSTSKWPIKILAANCMYRISESMLLKYEKNYKCTNEQLFTEIEAMISAIMGACSTNLEKVISTKCANCVIEKREKSVRKAAYILGKTGRILDLIEKATLPALDPHQMASIDEWRLAYKLEI
ncbi:uncharacterized protein LOC120073776 isoform X2 [Benincasa hispida]|uniref:uncharacterized protein LOC120073776 isoform X2 n=1 Tax=Benincasa hispida TaxID=102211 RepID=UPI001902AA4D|nr:uncharacterized protein LOC120073776 isoform X2 [Benincasa hispida]